MKLFYSDNQVVKILGWSFSKAPRQSVGASAFFAGPNEPASREVLLRAGMNLTPVGAASIKESSSCKIIPVSKRNMEIGTTFAVKGCDK